jgi:hypothetical protein
LRLIINRLSFAQVDDPAVPDRDDTPTPFGLFLLPRSPMLFTLSDLRASIGLVAEACAVLGRKVNREGFAAPPGD